jgi:hypothetical protein
MDLSMNQEYLDTTKYYIFQPDEGEERFHEIFQLSQNDTSICC